jgi:hypothetical protein
LTSAENQQTTKQQKKAPQAPVVATNRRQNGGLPAARHEQPISVAVHRCKPPSEPRLQSKFVLLAASSYTVEKDVLPRHVEFHGSTSLHGEFPICNLAVVHRKPACGGDTPKRNSQQMLWELVDFERNSGISPPTPAYFKLSAPSRSLSLSLPDGRSPSWKRRTCADGLSWQLKTCNRPDVCFSFFFIFFRCAISISRAFSVVGPARRTAAGPCWAAVTSYLSQDSRSRSRRTRTRHSSHTYVVGRVGQRRYVPPAHQLEIGIQCFLFKPFCGG